MRGYGSVWLRARSAATRASVFSARTSPAAPRRPAAVLDHQGAEVARLPGPAVKRFMLRGAVDSCCGVRRMPPR